MNSTQDVRALLRSGPSPGATSITTVPRPPSRWRTRVLIPLAVLLAAAAVLAYAGRDLLSPAVAVRIAPAIPMLGAAAPTNSGARTDETIGRTGQAITQAPGWIEPAPYAVNIPALTDGVIREVLVLEGERVEADQVVARLIDEDARLQLRTADAALAERQAALERARAGALAAEARVRIEEALVAELRDEITRKRDLVSSGAVSAGEFRRMEIRLGGLEAKAAAVEAEAAEARAMVVQAEAALPAASVLRDSAMLRLRRTEVRSTVAGVVLSRAVEPGSRISTDPAIGESADPSMSGVVLRVYDPEHLQVRVDVPLADAAKVGVGARAVMTTEALPDMSFTGQVVRVMHEANIQRNTVQLKVTIENPSPVLKPEMLARVKLYGPAPGGVPGPENEGATVEPLVGGATLLIPAAAMVGGPEGRSAVWTVDFSAGAPVARWRDVAAMPSSDAGFVAVTSGLRLTDRVVVSPPAGLRDGARVRVLEERASSTNP